MKKLFLKTKILTLFLAIFMAAGIGISVHAANDDPGAGRLSGKSIPEEFYETQDSGFLTRRSLNRYGSVSAVSPFTGKTYLHADMFDGRPIINGIDVSQWNKTIDWAQVKAAGIDYAFIRVGYRGYGSAGTLSEATKDPYYDANMQGAAAAGVNTGIYIFSQAITPEEAVEEAQYILSRIGTYAVSMPIVMDYEYASDAKDGGRIKTAKLSKASATAVCMAFCDTIAAAGYTPMVYANKSMLEDQLNPADLTAKGYRIWLANYVNDGNGTGYAGTYDFWQYSSSGTVPGINGKVDMNFYYAQDGDNFLPSSGVSISTAQIAPIPDQPYTGSEIIPELSITYAGMVLQPGIDYTVTCTDNTKVGKATGTVYGTGIYKGSVSISFNIVPGNVNNLKAKKRGTNYLTLSWSRNKSGSGYQIYRSTSLNGTYKKIKTFSTNLTTSFKNTKLNAGQCYYYKIRSYKKVSGKTYYGPFSPAKALYTQTGYTRNAFTKYDTVLYSTASTESTVLAELPQYATMSVNYYTKDESDDGWYYVTYETDDADYKGFIPSEKVTITKVGKVTNTNIVNVRKSASIKSKKLTTLKRNKKVTVLSTSKKKGIKWYKVKFTKDDEEYTGWISSPFIKIQ
ncbi:MAG: GH25 family lysozyme [Clostridiales bacterium]|nr:GH25 family lysozyme [Clostridiales bacterium]